jgi:AAA domain, putative AbiEii toxin, Type IV TA system/AAA domain
VWHIRKKIMLRRKARTTPRNGSAKGNPAPRTTGTYFLSLELENIRCFSKRQVLDLSDGKGRPARWTILLGENGTGKTTALHFLAAHSRMYDLDGGIAVSRDGIDDFKFYVPGIRGILRGLGSANPQIAVGAIDGLNFTGAVNRTRTSVWTWDCTPERRVRTNEFPFDPPICYAYGTGRRSGLSSLHHELYAREPESIFFEDTALLNAEEWLLRLDYSAAKRSGIQEQQRIRLEMVKDILVRVLPEVSQVRFIAPHEVSATPTVEFKTPYGWVHLRQLGYGYRSMIAWIVDLASRMVERYPESPDPLAEPAVVLVDEIDLHLHPKWQRDLIGFLTEQFPNTQFIATAHSPLIVQAASDANIALLKREGDHVVIENNPETIRGWRIDQILTSDLFGLETARPPDIEKPLRRRKELLTKPRLTKPEENELKEIETSIGRLPTGESFAQAKTMELIQSSLDILKKKKKKNKRITNP